jgi:integrase/recombinase XerD
MASKYVRKTDRVTKPEGKAAVVSPEDMARLFNYEDGFKSFRDRALFGLCRYTACRINEACQLKADDVFMANGEVKQEVVFRSATTKGEYGGKTVKVAGELRALLAEYGHPGKEYLFPGRHGRGHINPVSASNLFKETCDRLGLEHVSTHSFRRTAINRMREAGVKLEAIQKVSGHRSLDGLAHYLEVTDAELKGAVACL